MPIISISSDCGANVEALAHRVAEEADYRVLDRGFLSEVAEKHGVSRARLDDVLESGPGFLGFGTRTKRRYLAMIQHAVLEELLKDRIVTLGLSAHLYVRGVSHFIRVRVLCDLEARARHLAEQEGCSIEKALRTVKLKDRRRLQWSLEFFDLDESDPALHDMLIDLREETEEQAVQRMCDALNSRSYQPITYSIKCLEDQALAARVRVALFDRFPDLTVKARGTTVFVATKAPPRHKHKKVAAIKEAAREVPGVDYVEVHLSPETFAQATANIP